MPSSSFAPRRAVMVAALAALAAACNHPAADIAGDPWSLRDIDGQPAAAPASILLKDDHATGNTGCNPYSGRARISGGDITFGPMITTKMACLPQAKMD